MRVFHEEFFDLGLRLLFSVLERLGGGLVLAKNALETAMFFTKTSTMGEVMRGENE